MPGTYRGNIEIHHLIEGAKKACGTAVIIDVFRAFSLECCLYGGGARLVRPVGRIEDAFEFKKRFPEVLLAGERGGRKCEGFDFGNSPSAAAELDLAGKTVIHTTSAGTQGIVNATNADVLLTGSFLNAGAIARYIIAANPDTVSLVCMGNGGVRPAKEDELCAQYIKSLLLGKAMPDLEERLADLRTDGGEHFFNPDTQDVFPEPDFHMCVRHDIYDFVLLVNKDDLGFRSDRVDVPTR